MTDDRPDIKMSAEFVALEAMKCLQSSVFNRRDAACPAQIR